MSLISSIVRGPSSSLTDSFTKLRWRLILLLLTCCRRPPHAGKIGPSHLSTAATRRKDRPLARTDNIEATKWHRCERSGINAIDNIEPRNNDVEPCRWAPHQSCAPLKEGKKERKKDSCNNQQIGNNNKRQQRRQLHNNS